MALQQDKDMIEVGAPSSKTVWRMFSHKSLYEFEMQVGGRA